MSKYIEKLASEYVFNYNIYMQNEQSELTEKDIISMEANIVVALIMELGYENKDGVWEKK